MSQEDNFSLTNLFSKLKVLKDRWKCINGKKTSSAIEHIYPKTLFIIHSLKVYAIHTQTHFRKKNKIKKINCICFWKICTKSGHVDFATPYLVSMIMWNYTSLRYFIVKINAKESTTLFSILCSVAHHNFPRIVTKECNSIMEPIIVVQSWDIWDPNKGSQKLTSRNICSLMLTAWHSPGSPVLCHSTIQGHCFYFSIRKKEFLFLPAFGQLYSPSNTLVYRIMLHMIDNFFFKSW